METTQNSTNQKWILGITAIASFMVSLDAQVVATALHTIRTDLTASPEQLEWTVNSYNLTFAVFLMFASALGERYGRKKMFVSGIWLFALSSVACALSADINMLIIARCFQGLGSAFIMPISMALLSNAFDSKSRGKALGIFSGIVGIALIAGPVVGGAFSQGLDWRWIFWMNLPIGMIILIFVRSKISESNGAMVSFDIAGIVWISLSVIGFIVALMRGNKYGWSSMAILSSIAIGIISTLIFIRVEARKKEPMIPLILFSSKGFSVGIATSFFLYATVYAALYFQAQFLQTGLGFSPFDAGLRLLPWTATLFVVAPISGRLINKLGEKFLIATGLALQAAGMLWIGLSATPGVYYKTLILPMILAGAGVSMTMPSSQSIVLRSVTPLQMGKASGTFNMFRMLGGAFGIAVVASLFSLFGNYSSAPSFTTGFGPVMIACACISLTGCLISLLLPSSRNEGKS